MTEFLDWKALTEEQFLMLEQIDHPDELRLQLRQALNISYEDARKTEIAENFHLFNYTFCKDQAFDGRRTSTFLSIMNEIFLADTTTYDPARTREASFSYFQNLLLSHSVERSPKSIQVFVEKDLELILKYVVDSYFRQFHLYKYVFSPRLRLIMTQTMPHGVEMPSLSVASLNLGSNLVTDVSVAEEKP